MGWLPYTLINREKREMIVSLSSTVAAYLAMRHDCFTLGGFYAMAVRWNAFQKRRPEMWRDNNTLER